MHAQKQPHCRISGGDAGYHGALGQLIGHGVEDLAEICDHIIPSGYPSVKNIAQPRRDQSYERGGKPLLRIQDNEHRNEQQAKIAEKIGYRQDFAGKTHARVTLF